MDKFIFNHCLKNIRNEECFKTIYDFYYGRLSLYITRKYNLRYISEDIVQECFITLLNLKEYKFIEFYNAWLYKICDNLVLKTLNKENTEIWKAVGTFNFNEFAEEWNGDVYTEDFGCFQGSISKLDKSTQEIFYLYYVLGFKQNESRSFENVICKRKTKTSSRNKIFRKKRKSVTKSILESIFII